MQRIARNMLWTAHDNRGWILSILILFAVMLAVTLPMWAILSLFMPTGVAGFIGIVSGAAAVVNLIDGWND